MPDNQHVLHVVCSWIKIQDEFRILDSQPGLKQQTFIDPSKMDYG